MQMYSSDGSRVGTQTDLGVGSWQGVSATALVGGGFALYWPQYGSTAFYDSTGSITPFAADPYASSGSDVGWISGGSWVTPTYVPDGDGDGSGVFQTIYQYDGTLLSGPAQVNTSVEGDQRNLTIAPLKEGGWVGIWTSNYMSPEGPRQAILQQLYDSTGAKIAGETTLLVTSYTGTITPTVTALEDGSWISAWTTYNDPTPYPTAFQQHFSATGEAVSEVDQIGPTDNSSIHYFFPNIVALPGGGWLSIWSQDAGQLYFQAFNADGVHLGEAQALPVFPFADARFCALTDGGWVAVWEDGSGDIRQLAFTGDGTAIAASSLVNSFTQSGQMDPYVVALNDGGWTVTWTSDSQDGSGHGVFQRTFHVVNAPPSVSAGIDDQQVSEDASFTFQFVPSAFTDADGDQLSYTAELSSGGQLPSWLAFDAATRTFSGTPANGDVGTISVMVTATDTFGVSASDTFEITISNTNDAPAVANAIEDHSAIEDEAFEMQFDASAFSDVDVGDTLTYSAVQSNGAALPSWLSFDAATRTFSGTPPTPGVFSIRVTATDGSNGSVSDTFSITVANTNDAPTGQSKTLSLSEDKPHTFKAADFGFADVDGHELAGITITSVAVTGSLTFNGAAVTAGQFVQTNDLGQLSWYAGEDANGEGIEGFTFTLTDDGGTDHGGNNTSVDSYVIDFDVTEVVDRFNGTKKKDELVGTAGRDVLDGKGGNDRLLGDRGNDTLTGGDGADRFLFRTGDGRDTVKDFDAVGKAHDVLDLSDLGSVTSFKDLKRNHLDQAGKHVVIDGLNGDEIILQNVKIKDLDAGDFVF